MRLRRMLLTALGLACLAGSTHPIAAHDGLNRLFRWMGAGYGDGYHAGGLEQPVVGPPHAAETIILPAPSPAAAPHAVSPAPMAVPEAPARDVPLAPQSDRPMVPGGVPNEPAMPPQSRVFLPNLRRAPEVMQSADGSTWQPYRPVLWVNAPLQNGRILPAAPIWNRPAGSGPVQNVFPRMAAPAREVFVRRLPTTSPMDPRITSAPVLAGRGSLVPSWMVPQPAHTAAAPAPAGQLPYSWR